jgi:hypothetical protein
VLAVVQDQENVPGFEVGNEIVDERGTRRLAHPQDRGDRLGDEIGIRERRQLHEPDPVPEVSRHVRGDREGEAGLARAAGADEGQEAIRTEEPVSLRPRSLLASAISRSRPTRLVSASGRLLVGR